MARMHKSFIVAPYILGPGVRVHEARNITHVQGDLRMGKTFALAGVVENAPCDKLILTKSPVLFYQGLNKELTNRGIHLNHVHRHSMNKTGHAIRFERFAGGALINGAGMDYSQLLIVLDDEDWSMFELHYMLSFSRRIVWAHCLELI